jgi:hypothetical protein
MQIPSPFQSVRINPEREKESKPYKSIIRSLTGVSMKYEELNQEMKTEMGLKEKNERKDVGKKIVKK